MRCVAAGRWANYYPYAIVASFAWIGIWSFLLSTLISRWSVLMGIPTIILGATMVNAAACPCTPLLLSPRPIHAGVQWDLGGTGVDEPAHELL